MRNRQRQRLQQIDSLRLTVSCLPVRTREAMLDAVSSGERIIVGAYVDGEGGTCPMLAAHRRGGRTDFLAFAKAWDRYTNARGRARKASGRELAVLITLLEESLRADGGLDMAGAIAHHRELAERSAAIRAQGRRRTLSLADPLGEIRARRLRARAKARALSGTSA
jgi:hypothetical protein